MPAPFRMLVAEDEPNDVMLLKRAFFKAHVEAGIDYVRDGQEVIDYLKGNPPFDNPVENPLPNLLLLDLKMPRLNGFDVLRWLQGQPFLHRLPVVIFSSSAQPEDLARAYELGAASYVLKPRDAQEFMDVVAALKKYWVEINVPPPDFSPD
jgi:CheY-like chemotaxis protein